MKKLFSSLIILAFMLFAGASDCFSIILPKNLTSGIVDPQEQTKIAQKAFEEIYFQALGKDQGFFAQANDNFCPNDVLDWHSFAYNGFTFIALIECLEKKNCHESLAMLTRLNELFYYLFHNYISCLEISREKQVAMISSLHYLYNFGDAQKNKILRSTLSCIFIYMKMVDVQGYRYEKKKEILLLAFEDFRVSLRALITDDHKNSSVLEKIELFIDDLSVFGTKEPMIKPSNIKRWVMGSVILVALGVTVYCIAAHFGFSWPEFVKYVTETTNNVTTFITETLPREVGSGVGQALSKSLAYEQDDRGNFIMDPVLNTNGQPVFNPDNTPQMRKRPNQAMQALMNNGGSVLADAVTRTLLYEQDAHGNFIMEQVLNNNGQPVFNPDNTPQMRKRPNQETRQLLASIVEGALPAVAKLRDEAGLNVAVEGINNAVGAVNNAAGQIDTSVNQLINTVNTKLSDQNVRNIGAEISKGVLYGRANNDAAQENQAGAQVANGNGNPVQQQGWLSYLGLSTTAEEEDLYL